jgi:uncharacterized protein
MKLHLTTADNTYLITAYEADYIAINQQRYPQNLIIMPHILRLDWYDGTFADLQLDNLSVLLELKPEVVLIGTGKKHAFLHPKIYHNLTKQNIPVEFMTTAAACRTYNILMSEGRNVAAALIQK